MEANTNKLVCRRCGRCCKEAQGLLTATAKDIKRWEKQHREDILSYADIYPVGYADLWVDPIAGEVLNKCPFLKRIGLRKYSCTIWETRPEQCADWWCVLCFDSKKFEDGQNVPIGASHYVLSNLKACVECGKLGICCNHHFVSREWLESYVKTA